MVGFVTLGHEIGPQFLIVKTRAGQVGQQTTEGNTAQQQRLEFSNNSQVEQPAGDYQHHQILPAKICEEAGDNRRKATAVPQIQQDLSNIDIHIILPP